MPAISALVRKTGCHFKNTGRILREQSRFKFWFVLLFALGCEAGLFVLFMDAFRFVSSLEKIGIHIIGHLFSLFFLATGIMLVASSIVTTYMTVFRSDEIPFLIVRPFRISHIVGYKTLESAALSSWAFFFVMLPFLAAYALHESVSSLFLFWAILFSVPFLLLCSAVGSMAIFLLVRWAPRSRGIRSVLILVPLILLVYFVWSRSRSLMGGSGTMDFNLARFVPGLSLASNRLVPSWWVSEGIIRLSRGQWQGGIMLWFSVLSSTLMAGLCLHWIGSRTFYEGWQRVTAGSSSTGRNPRLNLGMNYILHPFPSDIRGLVMKDIRTFLRDPMQWSQALIFFGLLGFYFANIRSFHYHLLPAGWRNSIAFLNIFSVSAVICSLGARFIYPQLSLEGQGFWIIGLSPVSMRKVLLSKFILSAFSMLTISILLMYMAAQRLEASPLVVGMAVFLISCIAIAVCACSTGFGAIFLDLQQRNPAAIVSGFGGTLNLVVCLSFMLVVIVPFAFLFHLHIAGRLTETTLRTGLWLSGAGILLITAVAVITPLWLGIRSLNTREF